MKQSLVTEIYLLLNNEPKVEECDATEVDSSTNAGNTIIQPITYKELF
jgi:hypothetical protein